MTSPPPTLAPPNSTDLERAADLLAAIRLGDIDVPLRELWSAQDCPENLLAWLAWALSIDNWSPDWPLHIRRARVASAIAVQRRKGTVQSVEDVIASFGGSVVLQEWWEADPPGTPHTFQLNLTLGGSGGPPSDEFLDAVVAEVERTKPVRSHFTVNAGEAAEGAIGLFGAARPMIYARVFASAPPA